MTEDAGGTATSALWVKVLWLLGLALAIRLVALVVANAWGPDGSVGDLIYHSQLIADPIGHLRDSSGDVGQYAPYLGIFEWLTAKPWVALGFSVTTALRLGSITWDLVAMALLLLATIKRFPDKVVFVGLMWAASPLLWPASAYSAQDELIAAAVVSAVVLLLFTHRRTAAVVLCVLGLFLAKILLIPIVVAILLTAPRGSRVRLGVIAAATAATMALFTWAVSGTNGLTQQTGYSVDILGFSITAWSTLFLHDYVSAAVAIRWSLVLVAVALALTTWWWSTRRVEGDLETPRLAAAYMFVACALLGISNPEYLAIAAPIAIVGCIGLERIYQWLLLLVTSAFAWGINGVYYLLRNAYDPSGSLLGVEGFAVPVGKRVHLLDALHQVLIVCFLYFALWLARNFIIGPRRVAANGATGGTTTAAAALSEPST